MPSKDQKSTNATPHARVPANPDLNSIEEFASWAMAYTHQALNDVSEALTDFEGGLSAYRQQADSNMMMKMRERSRAFLREHPAFR